MKTSLITAIIALGALILIQSLTSCTATTDANGVRNYSFNPTQEQWAAATNLVTAANGNPRVRATK
jgi:hypothetical protein